MTKTKNNSVIIIIYFVMLAYFIITYFSYSFGFIFTAALLKLFFEFWAIILIILIIAKLDKEIFIVKRMIKRQELNLRK